MKYLRIYFKRIKNDLILPQSIFMFMNPPNRFSNLIQTNTVLKVYLIPIDIKIISITGNL